MSPSANISEAPLVLIVDDDVSVRRSTARLLRSSGMRAESFAFASVQHLLDSESTIEADCLILDIRMPGIDELQLMRRLMANSQRIPVIFFSGEAKTSAARGRGTSILVRCQVTASGRSSLRLNA
jgi:FixJ family two-component response regulator